MKYAGSCGSDFVEDICHRGSITEERFEVFINGLTAPCNGFEIGMECISPVSEPVYENGLFTGGVYDHETCCQTEEILDRMYLSGECGFVYGSRFTLTIRKNDREVHISGVVTGSKKTG